MRIVVKMVNPGILLLTTIYLLQCAAQDVLQQSECGTIAYGGRRLTVSINSERNDTGEWVTTFSALKNSSSLTKNVKLDVTHAVTECHGNNIIHIQGVIRGNSSEENKHNIYFHKKCSKTVSVTNNGRMVYKIDMEKNGVAITNRPLMDNELFEVRLDKRIIKRNYAIGFGVTILSPNYLDVPEHMNGIRSGTWMLYHKHLYNNGSAIKANYLKQSLDEFAIGGRVGVMRSKSGTLHFYLNGVDQGPTDSNSPYPVYGVFELYGDAVQGTITNPP